MEPPAQPRTQVGAGRNARGGWFRPCHAGRQTGARWVGARSLGVGGRSKNSGGPGGENGGGRPKSAGLPRLPQRVGAHAADTLAHRHSTPTAHTTQQTPDTHTPRRLSLCPSGMCVPTVPAQCVNIYGALRWCPSLPLLPFPQPRQSPALPENFCLRGCCRVAPPLLPSLCWLSLPPESHSLIL